MSAVVPFVEDKTPDFSRITRLLERSSADGRWANFGPVWLELKRVMEEKLELPGDRCALPCASGTHALMAALALAERNGKLRWVTPDYAFRATAVGPFAGCYLVDCDAQGFLSTDVLRGVVIDNFDAVVVMNPFGLFSDLGAAVTFARNHRKALIIDNAHAFVGFDRTDQSGIFECLSLHHTKPFGFGEGGCLILDRELEDDGISALDFGYQWPWPGGVHALSNGKLADGAAAFIVDRIVNSDSWAGVYREQFTRIWELAVQAGFSILAEPSQDAMVRGNVPLLAPRKISFEALSNDVVTLQKYYRPITGLQISQQIYDHIVNVPCHCGVAKVEDDDLKRVFGQLLDSTY